MIIKVRDMIRLIERDGWYLVEQHGSHMQYRHASKKGRVTIRGKSNHDLDSFLVDSIIRQAGLSKDEVRRRFRKN